MANSQPSRQQLISVQKSLLIDFVKENEKLQSGRFDSHFSFKDSQDLWQRITNTLNAVPGGANKDWRQWRKTWQDLKKNVKAKASANKRLSCATGGGGPPPSLENTEKDILDIISPEVIDGIPNIEESVVTFDEIPLEYEDSFNTEGGDCGWMDHGYAATEPSTSAGYHHPHKENIGLVGTTEESIATRARKPTTPQSTPRIARPRLQTTTIKKNTKTKRLENSLNISEKLCDVLNKRGTDSGNYQATKTAYLNHRITYENRKLEVMEETKETLKNIFLELKTISNVLSNQK